MFVLTFFVHQHERTLIGQPIITTTMQTRTSLLLFIAQFIRSLEVSGHCASIVLFGTSKAHETYAKNLLRSNNSRKSSARREKFCPEPLLREASNFFLEASKKNLEPSTFPCPAGD